LELIRVFGYSSSIKLVSSFIDFGMRWWCNLWKWVPNLINKEWSAVATKFWDVKQLLKYFVHFTWFSYFCALCI
jgi:hypothetical protein